MDGEPIFEEVQSFTEAPLVRWVLGVGMMITTIAVGGAMAAAEWQQNPTVGTVLLTLGMVIPLLLTLALMITMHLRVRVIPGHVLIRFRPFRERRIPLEEIDSAVARTYRPIREYGGWGIRYAGLRSRAYNVMGNEGVQLKLKSGHKVLIGSQRAQELEQAIQRAMARSR